MWSDNVRYTKIVYTIPIVFHELHVSIFSWPVGLNCVSCILLYCACYIQIAVETMLLLKAEVSLLPIFGAKITKYIYLKQRILSLQKCFVLLLYITMDCVSNSGCTPRKYIGTAGCILCGCEN
jgi:hypothetical protein